MAVAGLKETRAELAAGRAQIDRTLASLNAMRDGQGTLSTRFASYNAELKKTDEVAAKVKEAEAHAADDAKQREEIDARNRAEAEAYQKEQAAKAAQGAPQQENPADATRDGEVVDAEFAEAK